MPVKKHYIPYLSLISGIIIIILVIGLTLFLKWNDIQLMISRLTCQQRINTVFYCQ